MRSNFSFAADAPGGDIRAHLLAPAVHFNGLVFQLSADRTNPSLIQGQSSGCSSIPEQARLLAFLRTLQGHGMFNSPNEAGRIVYVEDQFVN